MARGRIAVSRNFTFKSARLMTVDTAKAAGLTLCAYIENRTLAGRDETGKAFAPYSPDYAKYVKHRERPVDLHASGEMLGDLDVVVATSRRIGIGFRSAVAEQRALYHDGLAGHDGKRGSNPLRRFMGLQPSWVDAVVRVIRAGIRF